VSEANQITSRNRGHKVQTVIDELNLYTRGWLNYYKLSSTYKEVRALSVWVRRLVVVVMTRLVLLLDSSLVGP
jgi:hypothetical protein